MELLPLEDKENEITVIPKLLDKPDVEGAVICIDAIGTQTDIAALIPDKKADYFLAVKDNQGSLHEAVIDTFSYSTPFDESSEMEADHGRVESQQHLIVSFLDDSNTKMRFPNLVLNIFSLKYFIVYLQAVK